MLPSYGGMYLPPYFFLPQHIIFSKKILCCAPCPQHNIFEKIMSCGKFDSKVICGDKLAQYFLKK